MDKDARDSGSDRHGRPDGWDYRGKDETQPPGLYLTFWPNTSGPTNNMIKPRFPFFGTARTSSRPMAPPGGTGAPPAWGSCTPSSNIWTDADGRQEAHDRQFEPYRSGLGDQGELNAYTAEVGQHPLLRGLVRRALAGEGFGRWSEAGGRRPKGVSRSNRPGSARAKPIVTLRPMIVAGEPHRKLKS